MKLAVIGTGYVGLSTTVTLGLLGHQVAGIDIDPDKVARLKRGEAILYEPGLGQELRKMLQAKKVSFTTSLQEGIKGAEAIFICVGTPSLPDGSANLLHLEQAVEDLRQALASDNRTDSSDIRVILLKSTVPVGTNDRIARMFANQPNILVGSNPEFLREGSALADSLHPARIVIGADDPRVFSIIDQIYHPIMCPRVYTTRTNAEMIKYGSNALLATKISFINELARLCAKTGVDAGIVAEGMGLDPRIGPQFLGAGLGYGGSCFPKDTAALLELGQRHGLSMPILSQVQQINESQPAWFVEQMKQQMSSLEGKRIALLGLSFKPDTDDVREAASLKLIALLQKEGAILSAFDPLANEEVRRIYPDIDLALSPYGALQDADAAVLVTEWKVCVELDWALVREKMKQYHLFDGRNAWPRARVRAHGFHYVGVGRS